MILILFPYRRRRQIMSTILKVRYGWPKTIEENPNLLWAFLKFSVAAATATATFSVLSEHQADDHEEFKKNSIGQKFELT